jgi:hypothetical protein
MKFCYCDESGTGDEPIAVMVGVIVDATRMHVTKSDWSALLVRLSHIVEKKITEIHTRDLYSGNDAWRSLKGPQRAEIITSTLEWLRERKHDIVYVSVEKAKYRESLKTGQIKQEVRTIWRFMGLHLMLAVQRAHQKIPKNKGRTVFVFDNEERERMRFTDLIQNAPAWSDSYYSRGKKRPRLDQVVDVPYFGDSEEVHLLQVADFLSYFLRRHLEIKSGYEVERYETEAEKVEGWVQVIRDRCVGGSHIYPTTGRCECADMFWNHAPDAVRTLHK